MKGSEPPSSSTHFFRCCAGDLGDRATGAVRTGEGHRGDARVGDDAARSGCDSTKSVVTTPLGKPARVKRSSMYLRASRHVRRVLEHHDVARHDGRRRDADDLPQWEVPGHDREHRADRLVADAAARAARRDDLVAQHRLGVLGVVAHRHARTSRPRPWRRRRSCPSRSSSARPTTGISLSSSSAARGSSARPVRRSDVIFHDWNAA